MTWSSYAHLPGKEDEYREILSKLRNGMCVGEVDRIIAEVKGKERVQHHYRSNLANLGLFDIREGIILLNYDVKKMGREKKYIKEILSECAENCKGKEIGIVKAIICKEKTYDISVIVECLAKRYTDIEKSNFIRWIRPVVNLFKIIDILSETDKSELKVYEKLLRDTYLKLAGRYGTIISLEKVEFELMKINPDCDIAHFIERSLRYSKKMKFKIELLMLPDWATKDKVYLINKEYYTHIKIKGDFLEATE